MTPLRTYCRGTTLASVRDEVAGVTYYPHFDHQGTAQCLTNAAGTVTDRFASDAWGVQVKRTGSSINRQWYVGNWGYYRQKDWQSDYVRQRWYVPARAMWNSRDRLPRQRSYAYGGNRPADTLDPLGLQWKRGNFRYVPPLFDPHVTYASRESFAQDFVGYCAAVAVFIWLLGNRPLLDKFTRHWQDQTGTEYQLSRAEMHKVLSKGVGYQNACSLLVNTAVQFAEAVVFPAPCPRRPRREKIWHSGPIPGSINDTEDADYGWALGNGQSWGKATVSCHCEPGIGDVFEMNFTFCLTDEFMGNKAGRGYANPYICHLVGLDQDFLVKGTWFNQLEWRRGHFDEAGFGYCP